MKIKKQEDIKDCGISIVQAFHNYFYNRWISINLLKKKASYGLKGINIEGMCDIAEEFGMKLTPMKGNFEALKELNLSKPIIALIGNDQENHYVIIKKINKWSFKIIDPLTGQAETIPSKKFKFQFLDVIIMVEKTSYSRKETKVNSLFEYILEFKTLIPWIFLSIIISIIVLFSSSFFMKIIMDQIIPGALNKTLLVLLLGFIILTILGALNNGFKNFIIYKMNLQINMEITQKFNNKIKNANLIEVEKLTKADIIRRSAFIESISLFISSTVFSLTSEILVCLISSVVLIWINVKLFLISLVVAIILIISTFTNQSILSKKYGKYIKEQINNATINLDSYEMIKQLKSPKFKNLFLIKQSKSLYKFKKIDKNIWITNNLYDVFQNIITNVAPLIIIGLATNYVIDSKMSIGSLILYISMFHFFINPVTSIFNIIIKYPMIKKEMDMLQYILDLKDEKMNKKGKKIKFIESIKFNKLKFGYESGINILNIKKFEIKENIILKGMNGSGKSTLMDIISTNYNTPGVFFNNLETKYYNLEHLRSNIFMMNPSNHMPNIKVIDFITDGNLKSYENFLINYKKLNLKVILDDMKIPLEKKMINNASNFSSGQRQVIQLMKLFSSNYKLILLDESFDNINKKICKKIIKAINKTFKKALFVEISHNGIFVKKGKEVLLESLK